VRRNTATGTSATPPPLRPASAARSSPSFAAPRRASGAESIEQAGYPGPPLQLMDELTLTLPQKIRKETREAIEAAGGTW
jgi:hypothetical protein